MASLMEEGGAAPQGLGAAANGRMSARMGGARPGRRRGVGGGRRRAVVGWSFVLPAVAVFGAFVVGPLADAVRLSFTNWSGVGSPRFDGLRNVSQALHDGLFGRSLEVTAVYVLAAVVVCFGLALLLASALHAKPPGWKVFRVMMFVPVVSPGVAMTVVWGLILAPAPLGFLDNALGRVGLGFLEADWLGSAHLALASLVGISVWGEVGVPTLLILAGLVRLPVELFEAARIDGASAVQTLYRVTVPLLRPVFAIVTVVLLLWAVQVYTVAYVLTDGGPGTATTVSGLYIYKVAFQNGEFGYGSALSMLFALGMGVVALGAVRVILGKQRTGGPSVRAGRFGVGQESGR